MNQVPRNAAKHSDFDANTEYQNESVATQYDAIRFSSLAGRVFNGRERRLICRSFADLPRGATIVDFPCGTGRLAEPLLEAGYRIHGMDISSEMLQVASKRLSRFGDRFTTEVCDARSVGSGHTVYDGALCARVLMHFPLGEQIEFLRGVVRLTNGPIVINHSFSSPYQQLRRGVKRLLKHQTPSRHPLTRGELDTLLSEAGLREVRSYRMNSFISEAIYIVARPAS